MLKGKRNKNILDNIKLLFPLKNAEYKSEVVKFFKNKK